MDALFSARTTYSAQMYYHQIAAGKPRESVVGKKSGPFSDLGLLDILLFPVLFFVFFMSFQQTDLALRLSQSLIATLIAAILLMFMNRRKKNTQSQNAGGQNTEADKRQAQIMIENSGLSGTKADIQFFEDCFVVKMPEITTEYRYEGISWIKETSRYFLIYWNRSLVIAVEKDGFYKGLQGQFAMFLQKKCDKTIERVRVSG